MNLWQCLPVVFPAILMGGAAMATPSVMLAWDPAPAATLTGYRLYQGVASQNYDTVTDVGNATTVTVTNLVPGNTYYFAITDYDINGIESVFSGEISCTVADNGGVTLQLVMADGKAVLNGTAPAGYQYDVQACPELTTNWVAIGRVTASATNTIQFIDSSSSTNPSQFYRLLQTFP